MLIRYLRSRIRTIILIIVILGIFSAIRLFIDMPLIAVLYPLILSIAAVIAAGVYDYLKILGIHRELEKEMLPRALTPIEEDYQKIIQKLREEERIHSQKNAADFNNMVEYYTVWAHQIKTPIASMRLNLQSEDSELARRLGSDLNRIEEYVEMVLTFLRLDSDSTDYLIKMYDLDELVRPVLRKFSREFIIKKLSLEYKSLNTQVITDEKWLSFVIEQVISNALKYTNTGGIRIHMREPGILAVRDTGIGIRSEDLPRIFENGYTGFNGREDLRASGIGLYLCRRICDDLGIRIWAESEQGSGTEILMDLNMKQVGNE